MTTDITLPIEPVLISDFSDFAELSFSSKSDIVYVLFFKRKGSDKCTPFYVGESSRSVGRFGDYVAAKFSAPTDFKVGRAVEWLRDHHECEVLFRYKHTDERKAKEKLLIESYRRQGVTLLNDYRDPYQYDKAKEAVELEKVLRFTTERLFKEAHA